MAKKSPTPVGTSSTSSPTPSAGKKVRDVVEVVPTTRLKSSALVDTRVIYCGDNLEQLQKLPAVCVDLIYIDYMRPRCVEIPS